MVCLTAFAQRLVLAKLRTQSVVAWVEVKERERDLVSQGNHTHW
jgi:hypothetical protein